MIMAGMWFCGDVPFRDVYIHGIIRDARGRKMSKSLGNGIDPLEMIDKFSADAVRFSLIMLSSEGQDIRLDESKFELGRNFSNKIWNAQRFLMMNLSEDDRESVLAVMRTVDDTGAELPATWAPEDRWILSKSQRIIEHATDCLDSLRLGDATYGIYHFFWHEFCDWYLEMIKPRLYGKRDAKERALAVGLVVLRDTMRLLHPFIPFITEEIWQGIPGSDKRSSIATDNWPTVNENLLDDKIEQETEAVQHVTFSIRNMRSEMTVPPTAAVRAIIRPRDEQTSKVLQRNASHIAELARCSEVVIEADAPVPKQAARTFLTEAEVFLPLAGLIDIDGERRRLEKERDRVSRLVDSARVNLSNQQFMEKAPPSVVQEREEKLEELERRLGKLDESLSLLG